MDRCCKTDTRANVGLEQPIASDSPFASHPSNKVPERCGLMTVRAALSND